MRTLDYVEAYSLTRLRIAAFAWMALVAVGLVAIAVDALAATWRSPAAAGLPLLTAYLITAANGETALALRYFVVPVVLWLVMLHTTARAQFGRWGTANAAGDSEVDVAEHDRDALRSFTAGALKLGAIAVMSRRGGGHVGVVSGIDANGNPIIISGNHGNRVAESTYPRGRIYAYVMP